MKKLISLINVLFLSFMLSVFAVDGLLLRKAAYAAGVVNDLKEEKGKSVSKLKKSTKPVKKSAPLIKDPEKPMIKLEMVAIKGGCFQIGSLMPKEESTESLHQVCVKDFEMGKYEVTQAQWQSVMDDNPSHFQGENLPVERVSWKDVQNFIEKLNTKTGKNYRLPTENEWIFACQAGNNTEYCGSNAIDEVAWYHDNSGNTTHAVGQKTANGWGLYDMSGNVMEWAVSCEEADCSGLVLRGGSWRGSGSNARSVIRFNDVPNYRFNSIGFRLALNR